MAKPATLSSKRILGRRRYKYGERIKLDGSHAYGGENLSKLGEAVTKVVKPASM